MPEETRTETETTTGLVLVIEERIRMVLDQLEAGTVDELSTMIAQWSEGETAAVLEALPRQARQIYWDLV
ncbi:MAG: hypothetical protein EP297_08235, partial [Gammaproteobacteria bacterium]